MPFLIVATLLMVGACRLAASGEAAPVAATAEPFGSAFRLLTDFGALGVFVLYLIWQSKRDGEKRTQDSIRWHALDRELVGLVEKCTKAITESTIVMSEIRLSIHENTVELRRLNTPPSIPPHPGGPAAREWPRPPPADT